MKMRGSDSLRILYLGLVAYVFIMNLLFYIKSTDYAREVNIIRSRMDHIINDNELIFDKLNYLQTHATLIGEELKREIARPAIISKFQPETPAPTQSVIRPLAEDDPSYMMY